MTEQEWAVYEHAVGIVWNCTPPTQERALHEAELAGKGHEAMPVSQAAAMRNAYATGRLAGVKSMRSRRAS